MIPEPPAVRARGLGHRYEAQAGELLVLEDLDLDVAAGEHLAVTGRSGSGKSTLLALLGALERPQVGELVVLGHDLAVLGGDDLARFRSAEVGFVFQHFGLLDSLTAIENVELAGTFAGMARRARRRRAEELLAAVGLDHRHDHLPTALSGGERQRVAVARALVNGPRLVLADEPSGNLDTASAAEVSMLLSSLPGRFGTTVVVVTHDEAMAAAAGRRVVLTRGRLAGSSAP